jgi:putative membrane protein
MSNQPRYTNDHLANERTFLAWIRTSIGIMAFGFVVVKFSLFVKQLSIALGRPIGSTGKGYSAVIGIALVAVGAVVTLFAYLRYRKTEKQIDQQDYRHSPMLINLLVGFLMLVSVLLIVYLIETA